MAEEVTDPRKGHRQRLRERFCRGGLEGMLDYEKLELLLTYAIPRCDVKPLAKQLLARFGSLPAVLDASVKELCEQPGIGENAAVLLRLLRELMNDYLSRKSKDVDIVADSESAVNFARMKIGARRNESFMVLYLNSQNHLLEYDINEGAVDRTAVYPRNVIHKALSLGAVSLVLIHNHPSGVCNPSNEDIELSILLRQIASDLDIRIVDHLIVSKTSFFSMNEHKLF